MKDKKITDYNEFYTMFYGSKRNNESQDSLIDGNLMFHNESQTDQVNSVGERVKT